MLDIRILREHSGPYPCNFPCTANLAAVAKSYKKQHNELWMGVKQLVGLRDYRRTLQQHHGVLDRSNGSTKFQINVLLKLDWH